MTLEERVSRIEDIQAIRDVISELFWLVDQKEMDRWLENFVEDVVYDVAEFGVYRGKAELRASFYPLVASFALTFHHISNQIVELEGPRAIARSYWHGAFDWQGRALVSAGTFLDELVKQDGRWLVAARNTKIIYMSPLEEGWAKVRMINVEEEAR